MYIKLIFNHIKLTRIREGYNQKIGRRSLPLWATSRLPNQRLSPPHVSLIRQPIWLMIGMQVTPKRPTFCLLLACAPLLSGLGGGAVLQPSFAQARVRIPDVRGRSCTAQLHLLLRRCALRMASRRISSADPSPSTLTDPQACL